MRIELGPGLVKLKREVYQQLGCSNIELITISKPSAYGEYAPYMIVETEEQFKETIYKMVK